MRTDDLSPKYRNVSGNTLIVNDIGLEIPTDSVISTDSEIIKRSLYFRNLVARGFLVVDASDQEPEKPSLLAAAFSSTNNFKTVIKEVVMEVAENFQRENKSVNVNEIAEKVAGLLQNSQPAAASPQSPRTNDLQEEAASQRALAIHNRIEKKGKTEKVAVAPTISGEEDVDDVVMELKKTIGKNKPI